MRYWLDISYAMYVVTYLTGLGFYIRFDVRRRPVRKRLIGMHLIMTVFTFIFLTGAMAIEAFPPAPAVPQSASQSTMWYLVRQHHSALKRYEQTHSGKLPAFLEQQTAPPTHVVKGL
ncbi:MAG: hypothetical protein M0Z53_02850 [Thermaerobacter sp.]|nr:hypothetical protein [Thermaerobacter sp.]